MIGSAPLWGGGGKEGEGGGVIWSEGHYREPAEGLVRSSDNGWLMGSQVIWWTTLVGRDFHLRLELETFPRSPWKQLLRLKRRRWARGEEGVSGENRVVFFRGFYRTRCLTEPSCYLGKSRQKPSTCSYICVEALQRLPPVLLPVAKLLPTPTPRKVFTLNFIRFFINRPVYKYTPMNNGTLRYRLFLVYEMKMLWVADLDRTARNYMYYRYSWSVARSESKPLVWVQS